MPALYVKSLIYSDIYIKLSLYRITVIKDDWTNLRPERKIPQN